MSGIEKTLTYRGDIRSITVAEKSLVWVTVHPQAAPTPIYRLDVESLQLTELPLPCGGQSIIADEKHLWVGASDSQLYQATAKAKNPKSLAKLPAVATKLALLSGGRLAALCDTHLVIIDRVKGTELQSIELPESGTSLAADPTGEWFAVGFSSGVVSVFQCEQKQEFLPSESEKLHDGAVTALLFEPEELRFFSAGADQKLLLTHARGKLEPEDRGRGGNHKERVTAMVLAPGDRFITASRDKSCKSWTRAGATKPVTLSDGVAAVVDMSVVEIHGRSHLAIVCEDNSIRLFLLDAGGRFGAATHRITDAYDHAAKLLSRNDIAQRGEGLTALSDYNDNRSIEMLAAHVGAESDHALRVRATELLAAATCPLAAKQLQPLLKNKDGAVRMAAFVGLCDKAGPTDLDPISLAFKAKQADIGVAAVNSLGKTAAKDENASRLLVDAIGHSVPEVRVSAQLMLESVLAAESPDANLTALTSKQADARTLALIRLYQRKMLDQPRVEAAIRRAGEDPDANVRRNAFLISLQSRKDLAAAIRFLDKDFHRQLFDLESFNVDPGKSKSKDFPKAKKAKTDLSPADLSPLLTAMSSRAMDTCLRGARSLALLGDARALGILLQLSREEDVKARGEVCAALAALGDTHAVQRLETMLDDEAAEVRDAAFTAYAKVSVDDPLQASRSGLSSQHEDIRRRALQSLVAFLRKSDKHKQDATARELLIRALNDSAAAVRGEAFKAALNMKVDGDDAQTLRFVLASVHADIRREVLTEVIAEEKQAWAKQLLVDLFSDPDPQLRSDAFDHAVKKAKKNDIGPMLAGLQTPVADIRMKATQKLISVATPEAQSALATAVEDDDKQVRLLALGAIIDRDASELVSAAMSSQHDDVRLRAACARAIQGDEASRQPLIDLVTSPEPEDSEDKKRWKASVRDALDGLLNLGDSSTAPQVEPLLQHKDPELRALATDVVAGFLDASGGDLLRPMIQDVKLDVQYRAALGLAVCGDTTAMPIVFSKLAQNGSYEHACLTAAVVYGGAAETRLVGFLDSTVDWIRNAALLTLLARDFLDHDGTPRRAMACLSAKAPRVRLLAARAVEAFGDRNAMQSVLQGIINDRGEAPAWDVSEEELLALIRLIVFGSSPIRDRVILVLQFLESEKQDVWDLHWRMIRDRFGAEIEGAASEDQNRKLPKSKVDVDEMIQVALGTYIALVREQGSYHERGKRPSFGASVIAIRETAIRRLLGLAKDKDELKTAARPVLIQALGDPNQAVRTLAFEQLADLGVDADGRAFAAIESGHIDLAVKGMQLLTSDADLDRARKVLADVILSRSDALALEAARLLAEKTSRVDAATLSLDSPSGALRGEAVQWLVADYDESDDAKTTLRAALESKYANVRTRAAVGLADKKDETAFDALVALLADQQPQAIGALEKLGDARAADAALDRIENDPEKTAQIDRLLNLVGTFRNVENTDRLLAMMDQKDLRDKASSIVRVISGYDQPLEDADDEHVDRTWEQKQHPRHDDILARLISRHLELDSPRSVYPALIRDARWSRSVAVDDVLATLANYPDDGVRRQAVEALGWRLRKRDGSTKALIEALEHRDPDTKFLAAEGLALGGHNQGINVLMSAVELLSDLRLRHRAVLALGELADPISLDLLLRLASDDAHALQQSAARAIGHLGDCDEAEKIFAILKRLAATHGSAAASAIYGLRFFATADAWQLLREHARDHVHRDVAIEQLAYNDDPATRDLMLEVLAGDHWFPSLLPAARRLFGDDSLDPDFAFLKSEHGHEISESVEEEDQDVMEVIADFGEQQWHDDVQSCLRRVCEGGESEEIFSILPKAFALVRPMLSANLLQRDPLPTDTAVKTLENSDAVSVTIAAHVVGRGADKKHGKAIAAALGRWIERRNEAFDAALRGEANDLANASSCVQRLIWAAGRTLAAKSELLNLLESNSDEVSLAPIRVWAINALAEMKLSKTDLVSIAKRTNDRITAIRRKAAELVAADDQQVPLVAEVALSDRGMFNRLITAGADLGPVMKSAAADTHRQSIVLPHLIKSGDVTALAEVAGDKGATESSRLGAIEGLGRIGTEESQHQLIELAKSKNIDEELQKAAWRSVRRSKRRMNQNASAEGES